MVLGAVSSALYIVDAHRDIAVEGFTCLLVFKNIFSFGLTFSGYEWLVKAGIRPVFIAISSVQVAICCLTVLMCKSLTMSGFNVELTCRQMCLARRTGLSSHGMIF